MMPFIGFLPATDERVVGTVEAIERELMQDGLVLRYRPEGENVLTDCRERKAFFCRVRSGWRVVCISSAAKKRRGNYSSDCSLCETISVCFRRNTIRAQSDSSEIFRRRFRMSRW